MKTSKHPDLNDIIELEELGYEDKEICTSSSGTCTLSLHYTSGDTYKQLAGQSLIAKRCHEYADIQSLIASICKSVEVRRPSFSRFYVILTKASELPETLCIDITTTPKGKLLVYVESDNIKRTQIQTSLYDYLAQSLDSDVI